MDFTLLICVFAIGVLAKLADLIADDGLKVRNVFSYAIGISYGILIAYVLVANPFLAAIGMATVVAVTVSGKIDKHPHFIGMAAMFLLVANWGLPKIDMILVAVFLAAGIADEIGNDMSDNGKIKGRMKKVFGYRLTMEVTAFCASLATGEWVMFLGMVSFDLGYVMVNEIGSMRWKLK